MRPYFFAMPSIAQFCMSELLKTEIETAVSRSPTGPGCYLWKNKSGEILYVGKAINLRSRLRNYLNPDDIKTRVMMSNAASLEWITTTTGQEALILEANLVKKHSPRFNVRLKDDKRYPYLCVSTSEPYPRVFITRNVRNDGNRYFGPYSDVRATRNTLALIHKIFPVRKTPLKLPLKKPQRPCMNFYIKRCLGPCQGNISVEEYAKLVDEILCFLEGRREILEGMIERRMAEYSASMEYEKAGMYRDMLSNIRKTTERQSVMSPGGGDQDVLAFASENDQGQIVLLEIRGGRLIGRKSFPLVGVENAAKGEIFDSFLRDFYLQTPILPAKILVPEMPAGRRQIEEVLKERAGFRIKIVRPADQEMKTIVKLAERNAFLLLKERMLATKLQDRKDALFEVKEMLSLSDLPLVIECYDISHFQGSETVASGVVFVDGQPQTSAYRHYRIRSVDGINDPASIQEVIGRRLQRLLNEDRALPDLIVIDGGFTQLSAACASAQALGLNTLPMIGLAKQREEIYIPGSPVPVSFDPESAGMKLLRHLRDEAHRFGITHHRGRRNAAALRHAVEEIPDIGPARRKALLKHLTDKKIEEADVEELRSVPGIGPELATKIFDFFRKTPADSAR